MNRIVWPSVAALAFIVVSLVQVVRGDPPAAYAAGLAAITCAVLALREK